MDIKKEVSKLTYEIYHDLLSDDGYYQYPNFTPVAFLINEAALGIKSGYEYNDIVSDGGDGLQDVFGIDIRDQERLDFDQELPAGSEARKQAIKAIGKLVMKHRRNNVGMIVQFLLVHSWYPDSIFIRKNDTYPQNVYGQNVRAPRLRGDSNLIVNNDDYFVRLSNRGDNEVVEQQQQHQQQQQQESNIIVISDEE